MLRIWIWWSSGLAPLRRTLTAPNSSQEGRWVETHVAAVRLIHIYGASWMDVLPSDMHMADVYVHYGEEAATKHAAKFKEARVE